MKIASQDIDFFSEISNELRNENSTVAVSLLKDWPLFQGEMGPHWIFVDDSLEPEQLVQEFYQKGLSHFVQKNKGLFPLDLERAGHLVKSPDDYFESQRLLIAVPVQNSIKIEFSKTEDKIPMLLKAEEFLSQIPNDLSRQSAIAVIEELYMNAILDAPREAVRLGIQGSGKQCELFMALNADTLQISCTDSYGSLDLNKMIKRLNQVYEQGAGTAINLTDKTSGAGIGCFILLEKCRTLIFGVKKGTSTKVTGLIPIAGSFRERSKMKKSLHKFEVQS